MFGAGQAGDLNMVRRGGNGGKKEVTMVTGKSLVVVVVNQFCIHSQMPRPRQPKCETDTSVLVVIIWDEILRDRGQI